MDKKSDSKLKALDVYSKYKEWCFNNGFGCENKSNFYDELKSKNMLSDRVTINSVSVRNVVVGYVFLEWFIIKNYLVGHFGLLIWEPLYILIYILLHIFFAQFAQI